MKSKELLTFWLFLFSYSAVIILSLTNFYYTRTIFYPGILILLAGIGLRIYTKLLLGKFFHVNIVIHKDHQMIKDGIYKYLRHPMYLANIFIFLGIAMTFVSYLGVIGTFILVIPTTVLRIHREEKYLKEKFGSLYEDYQKRSKRMIPYLY
ncbi:hypothetical protein CL619_05260 [archaeon]|nr:hypothetical protein [archaeon]